MIGRYCRCSRHWVGLGHGGIEIWQRHDDSASQWHGPDEIKHVLLPAISNAAFPFRDSMLLQRSLSTLRRCPFVTQFSNTSTNLSTRAFSTSVRNMAAIQRSAFFEAIQKHDPNSIAVVNNDSGKALSLIHI